MNTEQFYDVIRKLLSLESQYNIGGRLGEVRNFLEQLVQNPQQPQMQTQLATSLDRLRDGVRALLESFTPADQKKFAERFVRPNCLCPI